MTNKSKNIHQSFVTNDILVCVSSSHHTCLKLIKKSLKRGEETPNGIRKFQGNFYSHFDYFL